MNGSDYQFGALIGEPQIAMPLSPVLWNLNGLEWRQLVNVNVNVNTLIDHSGLVQWLERSPPTNVCHMWVEFVVGSLLCSERFFSEYSGFPLSSKTNISNIQFDLDVRHFSHEPLARVIAPALPVLDVKFTFAFGFVLRQWGFSGPR